MYTIGFVTLDGQEHFFSDLVVKSEDTKCIVCEPWEVPYSLKVRAVLIKKEDKTFHLNVKFGQISMFKPGSVWDLDAGEILNLRISKISEWPEYKQCSGES